MRKPDLEETLKRGSPLLAWTRTPAALAEGLGRVMGDAELEGQLYEGADVAERDLVENLDLHVRVWRIANDEKTKTEPGHEAGIGTWVVNGPFHPFWKWWMLGVVHLRPIEGMDEPAKQYPEAEYELLIVSLNPNRGDPDVDAMERGEDWGDESEGKFLTPPDLVFHFHGVTDEQARDIGEAAALSIVNGVLSPDSDFRNLWITALRTTVAHFAGGMHG